MRTVLQRGDPRTLSDEALTQICASTRIEDSLLLGGCLGSVAVFLLLFVALAFGNLAQPWFIGPAVTVAALFWLHHLASRPKRRYRGELAYRCGRGPFSRYVEEAEAALSQHKADWILVFTRAGLPHGDFRWLRLAVREGPPICARADLRVSDQRASKLKRVDRDLPGDAAQELLSVLQNLPLLALTDIPSLVIDGAPCHVAVLRRDPWAKAVASCNLGDLWFDEERAERPTASVCSKLDDMTSRILWPDQAR
jgi:hypothetical protein